LCSYAVNPGGKQKLEVLYMVNLETEALVIRDPKLEDKNGYHQLLSEEYMQYIDGKKLFV